MTIRISELKLPVGHSKEELDSEICRLLKADAAKYQIVRRSVDARRKPALFYVYTIDVFVPDGSKPVKNRRLKIVNPRHYRFPSPKTVRSKERPVVVGSGPAGLFCALMLARSGLRPIVLERGERVEDRQKSVSAFWESGDLNPSSNVQFGEGGAGTFSDGKLNTSIRDPEGIIRFVLEEFVKAGAPETILFDYRPHIGTDALVCIVRHLRGEIESLGGEFCFSSCLTGLQRSARGGYLLELNHQKSMTARQLVLAIGHSARDSYQMLYEAGLSMEAKSFAVGLRMEHRQEAVNLAFYGAEDPGEAGPASYRLTHRCRNGRGVYSFCMCPGGYVVNASSEPQSLCVNGMSYSDRAGQNANSALVVTVTPADYGAGADPAPLAGVAFQRELERRAFACAEGRIPVQRFADFCEDRPSNCCKSLCPQTKGRWAFANLRGILPGRLEDSLIEGLFAFGERAEGFDDPDVLLSAVESRTSSPLRILRGRDRQSLNFPGIYPCGEGAGYAGGIVSSAVDGIRTAEAVCAN